MLRRGGVLKEMGLFLGLLAWIWCASPAAAQEPLGNEKALRDGHNANHVKFETLLSGGAQYTKEDRAVSETAAKRFVYQFTWRDTYRKKDQTPQILLKIFQDKMDRAAKAEDGGDNKQFVDVFSRDLIKCVKDAFAKYKIDDADSRQVCVNIALLLPALGRCKHEEVGDFLTQIVADPKQPGLYRFCAVKGLREFFPVYRWKDSDDPTDKRKLLIKDRAIQRVDAVLAYINQDWKVAADAPKEVRDAVFFQRREGIRTLALAGTPAVEIEVGKAGKPVKAWGPAAHGLLRILSKEGMTPPASLAERCEAAIGVCQLKANPFELYQSTLAVVLVGQLTADFIEGYNTDYPSISTKKIPLLPWRVYGKRLVKALDEFPSNLPRNALQPKALEWIKSFKEKAAGDLGNINSPKGPQPAGEALPELQALLATFQPVPSYVFEDVPGMSLKAGKGK